MKDYYENVTLQIELGEILLTGILLVQRKKY